MATKKDQKLARWNQPGSEGFFNWLSDIKPKILTRGSRYKEVQLTCWQEQFICDAFVAGDGKPFKHSIILHVTPRRHAKSTTFALILLWLFTSRENQTFQLLGNSAEHCDRVQLRPLKGIIRNTPALLKFIPETDIQKFQILNQHNGNIIQSGTTSLASSFGDKLAVLWISDFHACPDTDPFDAMQASLLDTEGSLCLIDSNTDGEGGHVHALENQAADDPGIFCRRIQYQNLDTYLKEAPPWIEREKVKRLQKTQLPAAFDRDILGIRGSGAHSLFPNDIIEKCLDDYQYPVTKDALTSLINGREYVVISGLDRSKKIIGGDNTVWTTVLKVSSPNGEPEIYILNQVVFTVNTAHNIKKAILKDHEEYKLSNVILENYEVSDLVSWLDSQKIPNEIIPAITQNQNSSFLEFHRIAKEGRLHIPKNAETLIKEMRTFVYQETKSGKFTFGHSSTKFHDDTVYSLNWAIFAGRKQSLSAYSMGNIFCTNKRNTKHLCFLLGGDMIPLCADSCSAYHEVYSYFKHFTALTLEDIPIHDFFVNFVKVKGSKVYQAV